MVVTLGYAVLNAPEGHQLQTNTNTDSDSDGDEEDFIQRMARSAMGINLRKAARQLDQRKAEEERQRAEEERQRAEAEARAQRNREKRQAKWLSKQAEEQAAEERQVEEDIRAFGIDEAKRLSKERYHARRDAEHQARNDKRHERNRRNGLNALVDDAVLRHKQSQKERRKANKTAQ